MFKNRLQEYAQKASLPLPENAAAQVAVEDLHNLGLDIHFKVKETKPLKNLLSQFAVKRKIPLPIYQFKKEGMAHCPTFTATVAINGESYTGAPGNNKKAAARNAAYQAIRSIRTQDCNSFPQIELDDSKQDSVSDKRETDSKQDSVSDKRETCN